jgi:hypothetical protein
MSSSCLDPSERQRGNGEADYAPNHVPSTQMTSLRAAADGTPISHAQVLRDVIDAARLAGRRGLDAFGVGEHHRPDFTISAPEVRGSDLRFYRRR